MLDKILEKNSRFANTIQYKIFENIEQFDVRIKSNDANIEGNFFRIKGSLLEYDFNIKYGKNIMIYELDNNIVAFQHSRSYDISGCAKVIFQSLTIAVIPENKKWFLTDLDGNCFARLFALYPLEKVELYKLPSKEHYEILVMREIIDIKLISDYLPHIKILYAKLDADMLTMMPKLKVIIGSKKVEGYRTYQPSCINDFYHITAKMLAQMHTVPSKSASKVA